MRFPLMAVTLALTLTAPDRQATPVALAETDLGPITTADLEIEIRQGLWQPEEEFEAETDWRGARRALRILALRQIFLAEAEARGILDDPRSEIRAQRAIERDLLRLADALLESPPPLPTPEEVQEHMERHPELFRQPARASWRFMHFAVSPNASSEERETARSQAQEAREALLQGESFEDVAGQVASPPISGTPGMLLGPMGFEGRVFPEIERHLLELPLGEVSPVIDTPVGPAVLVVESREVDPYPARLRAAARSHLIQERRAEARNQLLEQLAEVHPVEVGEDLSPDSPDDAVVVRADSRIVTMGDLRAGVGLASEPGLSLPELLEPRRLRALAAEQLLLAEMESRGMTDTAELRERAAYLRQTYIEEHTRGLLAAERTPQPASGELEAFYEEHQGEFETDMVNFEAVLLSRATLEDRAGSPSVMLQDVIAREVHQRLASGEPLSETIQGLPLEAARGDDASIHTAIPMSILPDHLARDLMGLEPGEVSDLRLAEGGAFMVRLNGRQRGVPSLQLIRGQVRRAWRAEQPSPPPLETTLLERHGFRLVVDTTRLRWGEDGHLVVLDESASEER